MQDPALNASYVDDLHPQYMYEHRALNISRPILPRYHRSVPEYQTIAYLRAEIDRRATARWERAIRKLIVGRACCRWKHVVTRLLRLAMLKKTWGHVGMYLGMVKERGEEAMREMGEEPVPRRKAKSKSRAARGNR